MQTADVIQWTIGECESVLSNSQYLSLSTPAEHTDIAQDGSDPDVYPFVGVQPLGSTPRSGGIGNGILYVTDVSYSNGLLQNVTYGRSNRIRLDVIPVTDSDPKLRDNLLTELEDHFALFARVGGQPSDMDPPAVGGSDPQDRVDDFVRASGVPLTIEYEHRITDTDPDVAETVNVGMEVSADTVLGDSDDAVAFEETF